MATLCMRRLNPPYRNICCRWTARAVELVILGLSLGPFVAGALLEWYGKAFFGVIALGCLTIAALLLINRSATHARLD